MADGAPKDPKKRNAIVVWLLGMKPYATPINIAIAVLSTVAVFSSVYVSYKLNRYGQQLDDIKDQGIKLAELNRLKSNRRRSGHAKVFAG